ncbi:1-aminocyclopropane-1-carboxylate deaminase/D-cysteine desulfhydrase [Stackebrandtia soli]|uniref:1-aminocyclopropane-1-carboxylate deaminase/D-cysteine desulfhydrase n=1 Tax=Stackebrandtia soli TaxID=1892856 RepID=UPI0039ECB47A
MSDDPCRTTVPSPVCRVLDSELETLGVELWLKRDDLMGGSIPGNKRRKLRHNLVAAARDGDRTLLTFGGAYSHHIRAVAAAGRACGFETIGVIRGEEHTPLNWSLARAVADGMRLHYMDRSTYRRKTDADVVAGLSERFGRFRLLPEGGSNDLAVRGCVELAEELRTQVDADVVACPVGTGGTLAGIAAGLSSGQAAIGFSALRGDGFLDEEVARLQREERGRVTANWRIEYGFHHGGYARRDEALDAFIDDFHRDHGIRLEWTYVAKMLSGVYALARRGELSSRRVVAVLTGPPAP